MGKPIAHPSHAEALEQDAAINEFGLKMPRAQAEQAAHDDYSKRQRIEASAHHLAGMKAANASGDMEAARKHGLMYNLHSKALGHEPVGPAHPDVVSHMAAKPGVGYKFKPHRGDVFALNESKAPENQVQAMGKAEVLHALYKTMDALAKGEVVGKIGNEKGAEKQPKAKEGFNDIGTAKAKKWAASQGIKPAPAALTPAERVAKLHADLIKPPTKKSLNDWAKSELASRKAPKKKTVPCVCPAYSHPHRHGGGKCGK